MLVVALLRETARKTSSRSVFPIILESYENLHAAVVNIFACPTGFPLEEARRVEEMHILFSAF
jgi:hypothetical protein